MSDVTDQPGGQWLIEEGGGSIFTPEKFTSEQLEMAKVADRFSRDEVLPLVDDIEHKKDGVLRTLLTKAGELGLLMVDVPEEHGGLGADKTTSMLVTEQMVRVPSWAVTMGAHVGIGSLPIVFFGNEEQKAKYLPKLATGELIAAYALTEAGSGSDALAAKSTAVEDGDHYVLNGVKQWITNAGFADVFTVFAKIDGKFTGFIVERTDEGVSIGPEEKKMGIRGSSTCELILEEVRIPKDRLLGRVGKGHKIAFGILNIGRLKLGVASVGGSKYALKLAVDYAQERKQFKKPLSDFGLIRHKLGRIACAIYACESMGYRTSGMVDEFIQKKPDDEDPTRWTQRALEEYAIESSILKVFGSEQLDHAIDEALQIFGGYGFTEHFPIERLARDSRINRIFEGTNEVNRMLIPGTLLKRAVMMRLPLLPAIERVKAELKNPDLVPLGVDGSLLGRERRAAELSKRIVLYVSSLAVERHMSELEDRQDILAALSDLSDRLLPHGQRRAAHRAEPPEFRRGAHGRAPRDGAHPRERCLRTHRRRRAPPRRLHRRRGRVAARLPQHQSVLRRAAHQYFRGPRRDRKGRDRARRLPRAGLGTVPKVAGSSRQRE